MTMIFLKEHLRQRHYNWSDGVNEFINSREIGRTTFDPVNGFQVLFIINYFGKSLGRLTVNDGLKMEELISTQLPFDAQSELSVFMWLRGIYLFYGN